MSVDRIRMSVQLENATDQPLHLLESSIYHGDWTEPWYPPADVAPGAHVEWRSEGKVVAVVPVTGTEGRVRYRIGANDADQINIHWDSPLIESPYDNTFHVFGPPAWELSHRGGQGHHAVLSVRLRRSEPRMVPGFEPVRHEPRFDNHWDPRLPALTVGRLWNAWLDALPDEADEVLQLAHISEAFLPLTHADAGMCGGMVFSVMDYFAHGLEPPVLRNTPASPDDALVNYVADRLVESYDMFGRGHRWLAYSSPLYPSGDEGIAQALGLARGLAWVTYREEWPVVRDDIDNGLLCPIGLVRTDTLDIGRNHQVLAFGYQQSGQQVTLFVYDPNSPRGRSLLVFDITDTAGAVHITHTNDGAPASRPVYAFFKTPNHTVKMPPYGWRFSSAASSHGSGPGAVARKPSQLDVFWVAPDGSVRTQYFNEYGETWSAHAPFAVAGPGAAHRASPVATVARLHDQLDIFWLGADGSVNTHWWAERAGGGWAEHSWFPITGPRVADATAGISAVARRPEFLDVFWIGTDGAVMTTFFRPDDPWGAHAPFPITPARAAAPGSRVVAVSRRPGLLDVFWMGPDGAVMTHWANEQPEGGWEDHPPNAISSPGAGAPGSGLAAVARLPERLDVFWVGSDRSVMTQWWAENVPDGAWNAHSAFSISGAEKAGHRSNVAAVSRDGDQLDVFYLRRDGSVMTQWANSRPEGKWSLHPPFPITPPDGARTGTGLTAAARQPDQLDVFWTRPDGSLTTHWWTGIPGGGWADHTDVPISPAEGVAPTSALLKWPASVDVITIAADSGLPPQDLDPHRVLGPPNGSQYAAVPGSEVVFREFRDDWFEGLADLFNAATVTHGDMPTLDAQARADVIAFERNGASPALGGGWESCEFVFTGPAGAVVVPWNGSAGAPRDPHVLANGSLAGSFYSDHFRIEPSDPSQAIGFSEVVSFLLIALPELDVEHPAFTLAVRGLTGPDVGVNTPDIDAIAIRRRRPWV